MPPLSKQPSLQAMDIPSVRRPPVSVMMPADRVSTHDLPLAESLSALGVERKKYHNNTNCQTRNITTQHSLEALSRSTIINDNHLRTTPRQMLVIRVDIGKGKIKKATSPLIWSQ